MIKFRKEWPLLIEIARANRLDYEESLLLLALREIEAGRPGNEYNKPNVQNSNLGMQADSMANQISKGEFIYQKYLKGGFELLKLLPNEEPIAFVEFLGQHLMLNEGIRKDSKWIKSVEEVIQEIRKEFETATKGENNAN